MINEGVATLQASLLVLHIHRLGCSGSLSPGLYVAVRRLFFVVGLQPTIGGGGHTGLRSPAVSFTLC